ncbi:MAG: GLPGLI family protein [Brumimicrobium sp.]
MRVKIIGKKSILFVLCTIITFSLSAQMMSSGKIIYERRTNLEKRFDEDEVNSWMSGGIKEPKIDEFELRFTDSTALFKPILPEVPDEREWATMLNTSYQNLNSKRLFQEFSFWGTKVYMEDTIKSRKWIMTDQKRMIAGYECRQAMWEANDSTRIYAWYADELMASVGPETFNGLPGVILGLALEDGGVVYFAKKVENTKQLEIEEALPKAKKKDLYSKDKLSQLIAERFAEWGQVDRILMDMFVW